jgi:phosphoglycerol transferase MdoB-like AlkP superfamily enzyme
MTHYNRTPSGSNKLNDTLRKVAVSLRPLMSFGWRMLLILTISRTVFVAWQWQRVVDADMLGALYVQGLRFDIVLMGLMLVVPLLAFPLLASNRLLIPAWRGLLKICLPAVLLVIVFMECSTPSFVDQFDSRPNIFFIEYLNHPRDVAARLWIAYKIPILTTSFLATAMTWFNTRQIDRLVRNVQPVGVVPAILIAPFLLLLCLGMIRSTLDDRPVEPATVALSRDPLVNDLALNSSYRPIYGLYEIRQAGASDYGQDTLLPIVADYDSRVHSSDVVPVNEPHIPGLIPGGSISPAVFDPVVSQTDLAPTLLPLIGNAEMHPMIRHELSKADAVHSPGRAPMQLSATQGYLEGDRVAVLRTDMPLQQYPVDREWLAAAADTRPQLSTSVLACASWPSMACRQDLYRLPATSNSCDQKLMTPPEAYNVIIYLPGVLS